MEQHRCFGCMSLITEEVCPHCGCTTGLENTVNQLPVGTVLNKQFLLGRVLGQGGFGITYIGLDTDLDMVVAIKEFFPAAFVNRDVREGLAVQLNAEDLAQHYESSRERFLREARALARLQDVPQVVRVRQMFAQNNTAYIVMEYVRGTDLRHLVRQQGGRLTPEVLFPILEQVLTGLAAVHRAGLVHRDISPDNIMLQPDGTPKLLDFGAVRETGDADADIDLSHSTEAILKHGFAPMEQYRSRSNLGPWTDEYGICASVYYCLTGRVPPDAPARAMGEEDVDWSTVPGLEPHQRAALEKGMALRAKHRHGDLEQLHKALFEAPQTTEAPSVQETSSLTVQKKTGKGSILAAAVLLIAAMAVGGWFFLNREPGPALQAVTVETSSAETTVPPTTQAPETQPAETLPETTAAPETTAPTVPAEPWEANVLKANPLEDFGISKTVFTSVTFLDTVQNAYNDAIDVSEGQSGNVLAWRNGGDVYIGADGGINGKEACKSLFADCQNLITVSFGSAFHTEQTTSMDQMFADCGCLARVDLDALNTHNVTSMRYMFQHCRSPLIGQWANWDSWDVSNATDLSGMFYECSYAVAFPIGNWDVSSVTNMSEMFYRCFTLTTLNIGNWNTRSVTDMSGMFAGCYNLTDLDIANWDVSNVTDMHELFSGCCDLTNLGNVIGLDVSNWDVRNVLDMGSLFSGCASLRSLDISKWNVSNVTNMDSMFRGCSNLELLDTCNWNVGNVTSMAYMFYGCKNLRMLNADNWDVSNVTNMNSMFFYAGNLRTLDISNWDVSSVRDANSVFSDERTINGKNWRSFFQH